MECPACSQHLESREAAGITLDVCSGGCGGIWFDQFEFRKFDEAHEEAGTWLLELAGVRAVSGGSGVPLSCPRCDGSVLHRHFFSTRRRVEVDECPSCAGVWLDVGELRDIRDEFSTEGERKVAAAEYFEELFGARLAEMRAESEEKRTKAARFAHMFRFITPSYYIPGDQEWGAY
ncbi:MAG: zf-TFIIB domain-containing protein [Gemmatimonadota bacterium]|nr:zf-TFIIB domain-containing protein [Gemmatimonadota bacterium]MDH3428113.1 zf-TFIIB domain-containing protein [Gemmatimonadota bacterium]